jgi:ribose transport system substrate-binding protein
MGNRMALIATTLVAGTAAFAAGCGGDDTSKGSSKDAAGAATKTTDAGAAGKKLTIGYVQTGPLDYYVRGVDGAKAAAGDLNIDLKVLNSQLKPEQEIANVEDAVQQGVDGIVLFSVGKASEQAALAKARAAGIPVAVLYGYDAKLADQGVVFVQSPAPATGEQAGRWIADNVADGEIATIQGLLGRGDAEAYTDGFKKGVSGNPKLKIVATPAADWDRAKAQNAMQDLLSAHPALKAVFVQNEDMALGAAAAIRAAGKDKQVRVVAQNGSPAGLDGVKTGQIAATVAWSPAQEAQMAIARLVASIRDGKPADPKVCNTPSLLVTKDNVGDAVPWEPTAESTKQGLAAECAA